MTLPAEFHIWELAVRRERQGQGAGRRLVAAAHAYARAHGLTALTLTTFRELSWNEPLYALLGFRTLRPEELDERLAGIFVTERALGLPVERRCAMRLPLLPLTSSR